MHELPSVDGSVFAILNASLLLLAVWPTLSTVAATAVSYAAAGAPGVFLYYFVAILFSAILGAGFTLLLIALTGFILLIYTTLETKTASSRVPRR